MTILNRGMREILPRGEGRYLRKSRVKAALFTEEEKDEILWGALLFTSIF